ncbi:MAG: GNAT family N-acetyltransferase [Thermoplasmatota archaeon]
MQAAGGVTIRALKLTDTDAILGIDSAVSGDAKRTGDNDLWRLIAETTTCFGAEEHGRLVGFVLADVRPWEFGHRAHVGWIIALGVDPKAQGRGVGRHLGERVLTEFDRLGVAEVKTLVGDANKELADYFRALGFAPSGEQVLSRTRKS